MISRLKVLYLKKTTLREKVLLLLVLISLALIWLMFAAERSKMQFSSFSRFSQTLKGQDQWLRNREDIETELKDAMQMLDASKTYSSTELVSRVDALMHDAEVERYSINPPQSETAGQFTVHSIRLNVQRIDLETLIRFSDVVESLNPYISLERLEVFADRNDATLHNANFYLSSMEMNNPSS